MRECNEPTCGATWEEDHQYKCPVCGYVVSHYVPSATDIEKRGEAIQRLNRRGLAYDEEHEG